MTRPIYQIARDIKEAISNGDWPAQGRYHAMPYLDAMATLDTLDDRYGCDSGEFCVVYFLANASTWRGITARRIKAELKAML